MSRRVHGLLLPLVHLLMVASPALAQPTLPAAAPLPTDEQLDRRAGAWDRSVELEHQGLLGHARALLLTGWGLGSPSYEVTVRIAYLSLRLEDAETAVTAYERAARLEGAGPEATQGLASAMTQRGYQSFADGDRAEARADWQQALTHDPDQSDAERGLDLARELRFDPELWLAFVAAQGAGADSYGGSLLLHLPLQITDWLTLRGAYRHAESSEGVSGPTAAAPPGRADGSGRRVRGHDDQIALGAGVGTSHFWLEGLGLLLVPQTGKPVGGEAARLRLGHRWGIQVEQAVLARDVGVNGQLMPTAFVWPTAELGLAAGARMTFDDVGTAGAAELGVSIVTDPVELYLRGHLGLERWPVSMDVPLVLSLDQEVIGGGSAAAWFALDDVWSLGLHGQLAAIEHEDDGGIYGSAALGLRASPRF